MQTEQKMHKKYCRTSQISYYDGEEIKHILLPWNIFLKWYCMQNNYKIQKNPHPIDSGN